MKDRLNDIKYLVQCRVDDCISGNVWVPLRDIAFPVPCYPCAQACDLARIAFDKLYWDSVTIEINASMANGMFHKLDEYFREE